MRDDYNELTNLYYAAIRTGNDEVLSQFLNAGFPVNQINNQSYTALMTAACYGHQSSIELLLKKGKSMFIG
ncbi:ankyrin repeat domain-containing protein [Aliivibrio logei]|uniref:ankyrin repeat domain-containing protein n=1 Tax=Aliivibrio logei TaxID=688 RepID=UPI003BB72231